MYKYSVHKFFNGLRVLLVPSKESLSFEIKVFVNTGSDFETKRINGISHFLEHLCFKGTKKRPSNLEITKLLDSVGASYNAYTSREVTSYYAETFKDHKDLAMDIVSDIYLNSIFPQEEIEKERGVILEEMSMEKDLPPRYIWDLWYKLLYGDQVAGWSILGREEVIKKLKREDFLNYSQSQYRSQSTLIAISGNFSKNQTLNSLKKYFKDIRKGKRQKKVIVKEKQTKPQVLLEYKKTDQTHLILGVRTFNMFDKRRYALAVLDTIFDGGMSGYLWQLVREKLGAAYYISTIGTSYTDRGYWGIKGGIDNERVELVLEEILKEWSKLKKEYLTLANLKKAKDYLKGKIALAVENVHSVASDYAYDLLFKNKIETHKEYLEKINKVTLRDLEKVSHQLLKPEKLNLAIIGPHKNKEKLLKLLKI